LPYIERLEGEGEGWLHGGRVKIRLQILIKLRLFHQLALCNQLPPVTTRHKLNHHLSPTRMPSLKIKKVKKPAKIKKVAENKKKKVPGPPPRPRPTEDPNGWNRVKRSKAWKNTGKTSSGRLSIAKSHFS